MLEITESATPSTEIEVLEKLMQDEYIEMYGEPDQDPDNSYLGAEGFVLARVQKSLVGMVGWSRWENGDGKIRLVYVIPEFRRYGIASALLTATETVVRRRGISAMRFETGPKQVPAVNLYLKHGYTLLSEGFGFYKDSPGSFFLGKEFG